MEDEQVKVDIDSDEWYPVYEFRKGQGNVEVDARKIARWTKVFDAFRKVQDELCKLYEGVN
jgi:hypothetical protein